MKNRLVPATLVAVLLAAAISASKVQAQNGGAPARPANPGVAVIDISHIFKNHNRFKQTMDQLKKKIEATDEGLKKERDVVMNLMEQQKGFTAGSPDHKRLDDEILKRQADFNLEANKRKKEFMEEEA